MQHGKFPVKQKNVQKQEGEDTTAEAKSLSSGWDPGPPWQLQP